MPDSAAVPFGSDVLDPCEPCRPVIGGALSTYVSKVVGEVQGAFRGG